MNLEPDRWRCRHCQTVHHLSEISQVPDSYGGEQMMCPKCRESGNFTLLCDEPGCAHDVSTEFEMFGHKRKTCHWHAFWLQRVLKKQTQPDAG